MLANALTSSFHDSGFALQDIVNQAGRRLGFKVEDGRYRGTAGEVGFDGIWWTAEGDAILAEVKTTDVYRLSLETTATYRRELIKKALFLKNRPRYFTWSVALVQGN